MSRALVLFITSLGCFALGNAWTVLPWVSNRLIHDHVFSSQQYGMLFFILTIAAIIASHFSAEIGRKFGMKKVLLSGFLFGSIAMLLYGTGVYTYLVIGQFCLGLCIGSVLTALNGYLVLYTSKFFPILIVGSYSMVNLGSLSAPIFLKWITQHWRWELFGVGMAILFFCLLVLGSLSLPNLINPSSENRHNSFFQIARHLSVRFWVFAALLFVYAIVEISLNAWSTIYFHQEKGFSLASAASSLSYFWLVVFLGQFTVFLLLSKIRPKHIYRLLGLFLAIGFLGLFAAKGMVAHVLFLMVGALGCSAFFSLTVGFVEKEFTRFAEVVSGTMVFAYFAGGGIGSLLIGYANHTFHVSLASIYLIFAVVACFITMTCYLLMKRTTI